MIFIEVTFTKEEVIIKNKEFYKLKRDTIAKLVLSDKEILAWFLKRILDIDVSKIKVKDRNNGMSITEAYLLNLIDKELTKNTALNKSKIVDMLIETNGYLIDLEFNSKFGEEEKQKVYSCNLYSNNVLKGNKYSSKTKVNLCFDLNNYDSDIYRINGGTYKIPLVNNFEIYVYNIAYYKKILYNNINKKLIDKYKHIIMFDCDLKELKYLAKDEDIMKKIYNKVKDLNNKNNIFKYMSLEKDLEIMTNTKMDIARNEGYNNEKVETVLSMLQEKIPIDVISRVTGFDSNYIQSLQQ